MTTVGTRTSDHPIEPIFLERWSPRAFSGEAITKDQLMTILEAARWAPSSYNSQPWHFIYGIKGTPAWDSLFGTLIEFNQGWAKDAAAIVMLVSNSLMLPPGQEKPVPSHSHSSDAGCAWGYAALQAQKMGWHTHGMVGFDMAKAFAAMDLPEGFRVEMCFVVGKQGDKFKLPDFLQAREAPSPRKPMSQVAYEGTYVKA